jgi:predicted Zn-dependent protease with MMP-like domain
MARLCGSRRAGAIGLTPVQHQGIIVGKMDRDVFEGLVAEALESLPDEIAGWLDNVAIVVADWPTPEQLAQGNVRPGSLLFGLYVGVPKTHRGFTYGEIVPDKIVIFQRSIERVCRTPAQVRECVRQTVLHEVGHHFGMDEAQLRDAGV